MALRAGVALWPWALLAMLPHVALGISLHSLASSPSCLLGVAPPLGVVGVASAPSCLRKGLPSDTGMMVGAFISLAPRVTW